MFLCLYRTFAKKVRNIHLPNCQYIVSFGPNHLSYSPPTFFLLNGLYRICTLVFVDIILNITSVYVYFRYIMDRICEDLGVVCSLDPKPMDGDWNGAGAHCNYR